MVSPACLTAVLKQESAFSSSSTSTYSWPSSVYAYANWLSTCTARWKNLNKKKICNGGWESAPCGYATSHSCSYVTPGSAEILTSQIRGAEKPGTDLMAFSCSFWWEKQLPAAHQATGESLSWRVSSCASPDSSTSSWTYSQVSIPDGEISDMPRAFSISHLTL